MIDPILLLLLGAAHGKSIASYQSVDLNLNADCCINLKLNNNSLHILQPNLPVQMEILDFLIWFLVRMRVLWRSAGKVCGPLFITLAHREH